MTMQRNCITYQPAYIGSIILLWTVSCSDVRGLEGRACSTNSYCAGDGLVCDTNTQTCEQPAGLDNIPNNNDNSPNLPDSSNDNGDNQPNSGNQPDPGGDDNPSDPGEDDANDYVGIDSCDTAFRVNCTDFYEAYIKAPNADSGDRFGTSVSISGNRLAVGAFREGGNIGPLDEGIVSGDGGPFDSGAVYIYRRDNEDWTFEQLLKISYPAETDITKDADGFGWSVSLDGNTLAIGAPGEASTLGSDQAPNNEGRDNGAVYIFTLNNSGTWVESAYIKANDTNTNDEFGYSVSLDGDTLAVGAIEGDASFANNTGAVYIYTRQPNDAWVLQQKVVSPSAHNSAEFGASVSLSNNSLAIGAKNQDSDTYGLEGAAYIYRRDGEEWTEQAIIRPSRPSDNLFFGHPVSLDGDTLAVGAVGDSHRLIDDEASDFRGSAYVYGFDGDSWIEQGYLTASNSDSRDRFGTSVVVKNNRVVVSAVEEDGSSPGVNEPDLNSATDSGAIYVFAPDDEASWEQIAYVKPLNIGSSSEFGTSLALDNRTLVVGAQLDNGPEVTDPDTNETEEISDSGAAYALKIVP